jgi:hypothetical protein
LLSCSKQSFDVASGTSNQIQQTKELSVFIQLAKNSDFGSLVNMYNLLDSKSKYFFWSNHFLTASANTNTLQKKAKIDELRTFLTPELFNESSRQAAIFTNYLIPAWAEKAKAIFSETELFQLLYENNQIKANLRKSANQAGNDEQKVEADCFCHAGTSGYSCQKVTVGFPSGITIENGICEQSQISCNSSSEGCGFLWLQSCSGNHCQF